MTPKQHKPMKSERVQAVVSRWILLSIQRYKERLLKLKLLSLSLHVEMHDLLRKSRQQNKTILWRRIQIETKPAVKIRRKLLLSNKIEHQQNFVILEVK